MTLEKIKNIINQYKDKFLLNSKAPWIFKQNQLLFKKINNKYQNLFKSTMEIIYLIKNYDNLENLHIFCYCGNKNNFISTNLGYHKYCSIKCEFNDENIQKKQRLSKLNNIDENGLNSYQRQITKCKNTRLNDINKNGLNSYNRASLKRKQKMLNNIDNNGLNQFQKNAIKAANTMKNTINENGLNIYQESVKKTKNTRKNDIKDGLNSYQRAAIKIKKTCLNTINKDGLNIYQVIYKNSIQKKYQTMKKNHTFNSSKSEEECYQLLLQKFNKDDIERQYKSKLYPFCSDFYIKSLDLYIECNFHWTHCPLKNKFKPFKNSIEDLQEIEKLKNKNSKYYNIAVNTWSNLDVRKLNIFKKNKLKYKIFYRIEQFKNWYNKI